jgi:hypothetical protein
VKRMLFSQQPTHEGLAKLKSDMNAASCYSAWRLCKREHDAMALRHSPASVATDPYILDRIQRLEEKTRLYTTLVGCDHDSC